MRVLITGGAGFIGSHLAEFHLERGDEVHCVDDLSTGSLENVAPFRECRGFRFDRADIGTWEGLTATLAESDRVYHMAAVVGMFRVLAEPEAVLATNVAGTERVLRCAVEAGSRPRVIVASSSEVYGPVGTHRLDETDALLVHCDTAKTQWNYALSKLAGEALGITYSGSFDLPVTIARLFNTTGPRQSGRYGMVVPRFVRQAALGEPLTVFGDGLQTRSFCHVGDTVRIIETRPLSKTKNWRLAEIVRTSRGATISGTVQIEGTNDPAVIAKLRQLRIYAWVQGGSGGGTRPSLVSADGSFGIGPLPAAMF